MTLWCTSCRQPMRSVEDPADFDDEDLDACPLCGQGLLVTKVELRAMEDELATESVSLDDLGVKLAKAKKKRGR